MLVSILVLGAPFSSQSSYSAYRYTLAALEGGHQVHRVFFYQDGIHSSTSLATPPQDEFDLYQAWQNLQAQYNIDCVTCIAAAARRGVINAEEAERHNKSTDNLATNFDLSGLGQLVEATVRSDKLITFGA